MNNNYIITLLLVEDDQDFNASLNQRIEKYGIDVITAFTAEEALEKIQFHTVDVIVADIKLPGIDGVEFLTRIRAVHAEIPVIFLTGYGSLESAKKAVKLNASDYLLKPLDNLEDLLNPIHKAVHAYKLIQENKRLLIDLRLKMEECEKSRKLALKAYAEIKETQDQLIQSEKMETMGQMASGIIHDLRNPLAIIIQSVDYLEEKLPQSDADIKKTLKSIKRNAQRSNKIVSGLLDFSRSSKLEMTEEDINALLDISLSLVENQLNKKNISVTKKYSENLPKTRIDRNRIEQVLVNLFLNAIQAMGKEGTLTVKTSITNLKVAAGRVGQRRSDHFAVGDSALTIEIEDTGAGISEENLEKIFAPFFTTKSPGSGTGLGLAITKNIIDMHKGLITIRSLNEKGAKATLHLKPILEKEGNESLCKNRDGDN